MKTNPYVALSTEDFAAALNRLLPPGAAYPGLGSAVQGGVLRAAADVQTAQHTRAVTLSEIEADPAQTVELLTDWETEYGLPDPCTPLSPTIAQRQIALLGKIASIGGQSDAYLIRVAAAMGYTISIFHLRASRFGVERFGNPLYGPECDYTMEITVYGTGGSHAPQLECRLAAIAPAGDWLIFLYPG